MKASVYFILSNLSFYPYLSSPVTQMSFPTYMPFILELEPGKVYEFDAEWRKENMGRRGFSGSASYVVVTE